MPKYNIIHIEIPDEQAEGPRGLHEALFARNLIPLLELNYAGREFKAGNVNVRANDKGAQPDLKKAVTPGPPQFR